MLASHLCFNRRMLRKLLLLSVLAGTACSGSSSSQSPAEPIPVPTPVADEAEPPPEAPPENATGDFERFVLTGNETPCPPQATGDCQSSAELLADGTLRMDPWGDPATPILEAQVPAAAVAEAVTALTDPALLTLLGQPQTCPEVNQTETLLVRTAGTDHQNATGYCNSAPLHAVRAAIMQLTQTHFPNHSLISPPF